MFEFSIASWNVHMGLRNEFAKARDTTNRGSLNEVAERCIDIDADVLVLQEAWWWGTSTSDLVEQVATATGGVAHTYTSPTPIKRYPASWTISIITRLAATRLDDDPFPAMNNKERALLRLRLDESNLTIAGCHLDGIHSLRTRPDVWARQWKRFRSVAAENDIVLGDMNMWGPIVERNARPMRRAVRGRTWPAWRPHSQIDHLLINDTLEVVEAAVLSNYDSDHLPIRAVLRSRS